MYCFQEDYENVFKNISDDSDESEAEMKNCFRISKRRSIKKFVENHSDSKDSLYPMRIEINGSELLKTENYSDKELQVAKSDVFVFGSNRNENRGFTFKMGNFFRGILSMFRLK